MANAQPALELRSFQVRHSALLEEKVLGNEAGNLLVDGVPEGAGVAEDSEGARSRREGRRSGLELAMQRAVVGVARNGVC